MAHLSDEILLLAANHRERLTRRQLRHLEMCVACREELRHIKKAAKRTPLTGSATPPWSRVAPNLSYPRPHHRLRWSVAVLALAAGLVAWPRVIWPNAPLGPMALATYVAGHPVTLQPSTTGITGHVMALVNPRSGWMLLTYSRVTPLPQNQVYEAWWIQGGQHIRAGVFRVQAPRKSVWLHTTLNVVNASLVGITVEPAPGSEKPTGPRAFLGRLP